LPTTWVIGALCLTRTAGQWQCQERSIEIADGTITALHSPGLVPPHDVEAIDARGLLAVPGLVNGHTHSPDNLVRGSAPGLPLELWSLYSAPGREQCTPREIYVSALLGAIEMLRTGTTTVLDHVRISPDVSLDALNAVAEAYRDAGMRAVIAPVVADRAVAETMPFDGDDLAGVDIASYGGRKPMPAAAQMAIVEAFANQWHGAEGLISVAIGPSGPQRCSDALLELAGDFSARRGCVFHTHVLETRIQREMGARLYGKGMIAHLDELGLLNRRANLVHSIWLESGDVDRIARSGAAVVHNPVSNARLGSGFCRVPEMLKVGLRVALGTDSACCNDSNNLLEAAKWASLLHDLTTADPDDWVTPDTALSLATEGGADALGLASVTGRIAPGLAADISFFRLASPAFAPLTDPVRQLVLAENGSSVERVMVAGRVVLDRGLCRGIDEHAVWAEAQTLSDRRRRDNADVYRASAALEVPIRRMCGRIHAGGASCT
jgi:cytosine/adenosine deaminase-related metal-dependent hydrolase